MTSALCVIRTQLSSIVLPCPCEIAFFFFFFV